MIGLLAVSVELIDTFPRENVATRPTEAATYCFEVSRFDGMFPDPVPKYESKIK